MDLENLERERIRLYKYIIDLRKRAPQKISIENRQDQKIIE